MYEMLSPAYQAIDGMIDDIETASHRLNDIPECIDRVLGDKTVYENKMDLWGLMSDLDALRNVIKTLLRDVDDIYDYYNDIVDKMLKNQKY